MLLASLALLASGALATSCGTSDRTTDDRRVDSESHWLLACSADDDCGPDLQCWCGACTRVCTKPAEDCEPGVACVPAGALQATAACIPDGSGTSDAGGTDSGSGALPTVPGAYLCLPSCSNDSQCEGRRCGDIQACLPPGVEGGQGGGGGSGELECDESQGFFFEGEECAYCDTLANRHVQIVVSTIPEDLLRCDSPGDSCTSVPLGQSACANDGAAFGCTEAVVSSRHVEAFLAHEEEVAQQTCLAPGSTWQGCSGWWKWTCDDFPLPTCANGVCVDADTTDTPHVRPHGGPGDTHDRLPMLWENIDCDPAERAVLSTCEWLATMDGLLVGELISVRTVGTARNQAGEPLPEGSLHRNCDGEIVPALELEVDPLMRFGSAEDDAVTRVIVAAADLEHWVPRPQPNGAWGGIPPAASERAADSLHAGNGRLMPRHWLDNPGQTLVLPIVAGELNDEGQPRYGLGGHLIGMLARDSAGGPQTRVLFQRDPTACFEPYHFAEEFRNRAPSDFLSAVSACHAQGLPERPTENIYLSPTPLPAEAFDSLCVSTP